MHLRCQSFGGLGPSAAPGPPVTVLGLGSPRQPDSSLTLAPIPSWTQHRWGLGALGWTEPGVALWARAPGGSRGGVHSGTILNKDPGWGGRLIHSFSGQESLSQLGLLETGAPVPPPHLSFKGRRERAHCSAAGALGGEPGPGRPGLCMFLLGCTNRTARPPLPEAPLPGGEGASSLPALLSSQPPSLAPRAAGLGTECVGRLWGPLSCHPGPPNRVGPPASPWTPLSSSRSLPAQFDHCKCLHSVSY